jgi:hypothetical protein
MVQPPITVTALRLDPFVPGLRDDPTGATEYGEDAMKQWAEFRHKHVQYLSLR